MQGHKAPLDTAKKLFGKHLVEFQNITLKMFSEEFLVKYFNKIAGQLSGRISAGISGATNEQTSANNKKNLIINF